MQFKQWLQESKLQDIKNLQPNSVITVFHGTDADTAYDFCLNGIDAKKQQNYRRYPHYSGGNLIKFGLFIAPDLKTAQKFGNVILKFKTIGKNLIFKFPAEMKKFDQGFYKEKYPNSFRPSVTYDMLNDPIEPQALFIGLTSPRAIEKLFVYDYASNTWNSMSSEDYIKSYQEKNQKTRIFKSSFEPQEYNMSLEDFVKRLAIENDSTPQEIMNILKSVYGKNGYLTGIGNIPPTLLKRIERKLFDLQN